MMIATVNAPGVALGAAVASGDTEPVAAGDGCVVAMGEACGSGPPDAWAGLRGMRYIWPKSAHETNAAKKNAIKSKRSLRAIAAGILQPHVGYLNAWR